MDIFTRKEKGKQTSYFIIKNVLINDKNVILDTSEEGINAKSPPNEGLLVTSRTVENLEAFFDKTYSGIIQTTHIFHFYKVPLNNRCIETASTFFSIGKQRGLINEFL